MSDRRALLLDYAGVLTTPVGASFRAFEQRLGLPAAGAFALLVAGSDGPDAGIVGAFERGEISVHEFDAAFRERLEQAGHRVPDGSLVDGLFADLVPAGQLWDAAARAREAGIVTVLVSNSWGLGMYDHDRLAAHFDVQVISGEVGLRKPSPEIFELAAVRAGVAPEACAFVDDFPHNVDAARALGMHGVHHTGDDAATLRDLTSALGVDLLA